VAVGLVGLFWIVWRAVEPLVFSPVAMLACGGDRCLPGPVSLGSTPWDLAAASLGLVVAIVVAAALFRPASTRH
jgi:hypothetical protein